MDVPFTKMNGLGNDFMVIDNRSQSYQFTADVISRWANRKTGIGFDQMLVVEEPTVEDASFDYRIYNADGSEVEHCGNGARCFARYVLDRGMIEADVIRVNTLGGVLSLHALENGEVTVEMGVPSFTPVNIPLVADTESDYYELELSASSASASASGRINTPDNTSAVNFGSVAIGNPHIVLRVDDVDTAAVDSLGPKLESHAAFPARINVGFMQVLTDEQIRLRVFERGVGETDACGTGACAAVATGIRQGLLQRQVNVALRGGNLTIMFYSL